MADSTITRNALASSLKKLMAQKPFSRISINDICEGCGMNRKSFYYHFKDKYDLVNWIFYTEFVSHLHIDRYTSGWQLLEDICRYFYSERQFYRCALAITGQNSFRDYFLDTVKPLIPFFFADHLSDSPNHAFMIDFLCDGFLQALLRWLSSDTERTAEEFLAQLKEVLLLFARDIVEELGDEAGETGTGNKTS